MVGYARDQLPQHGLLLRLGQMPQLQLLQLQAVRGVGGPHGEIAVDPLHDGRVRHAAPQQKHRELLLLAQPLDPLVYDRQLPRGHYDQPRAAVAVQKVQKIHQALAARLKLLQAGEKDISA